MAKFYEVLRLAPKVPSKAGRYLFTPCTNQRKRGYPLVYILGGGAWIPKESERGCVRDVRLHPAVAGAVYPRKRSSEGERDGMQHVSV
jgi:hypothetical protein